MAPKQAKAAKKKKKVTSKVVLPEVGDAQLTCNEGDESDYAEETPAAVELRSEVCLVTASCPREYIRDPDERKRRHTFIPEDFTTTEFLSSFRRVFDANSTVMVEEATCHDEPHKRLRASRSKRERHIHIAGKMSGKFAHKKVSEAFHKRYGIRLHFTFKLKRFVGVVSYLMTPGKKPSTDLDLKPATYPPGLDANEVLRRRRHPGDTKENTSDKKKRKRLSFDDLSNIIIEGVGSGPLRTPDDLDAAARQLKAAGQIELWNHMGTLKDAKDIRGLLAKVWRLHGELTHPMWRTKSTHAMADFFTDGLTGLSEWDPTSEVLILSGDGGLGKTSLAEALAMEKSGSRMGYWFVDDPDDFRELDGLIKKGDCICIDEVLVAKMTPNQIKKLFDVQKARSITCRHFNGAIPAGCPRILTTNSTFEEFYPEMSKQDRKGVMRRQRWVEVDRDLRSSHAKAVVARPQRPAPPGEWQETLRQALEGASLNQYTDAAVRVCADLGVAYSREVFGSAAAIASKSGMKPLERRRFLEVCARGAQGSPAAAPRRSAAGFDDSEAGSSHAEDSDQ